MLEHEDHSSSDEEETNPIPIPPKRGTTSLPRQIPRPVSNRFFFPAKMLLNLSFVPFLSC